MAEPVKLGELIAEHQQALQLYHVAGTPNPALQPKPGPGYWIGPYTADHQHSIEVVDPNSLDQFVSELDRKHDNPASSRPGEQRRIAILSEYHDCGGRLAAKLQHGKITLYRSALPAKPILRDLANSLAEHGAFRSVHAVAVSVHGQGVLLSGDSGLGKSAIALELVSRGHTLVADDLPTLTRMPRSNQVYALCPPMLAGLLEVRALGILDVEKLFGAAASAALSPVNLVIELVAEYFPDAQARLSPFRQSFKILDVDIPRVPLPVRHATNPAVIVETLVKNHVLYKAGDDASLHLIARQRQQIEKQIL